MARLDTIRALQKRGLAPKLAEKTVDLGYQLGTLKKSGLRDLKKNFNYKEILQLIDVSKNKKIDRDEIVTRALEQGDLQDEPITADQALRRVEKKLGVIWSLPRRLYYQWPTNSYFQEGAGPAGCCLPNKLQAVPLPIQWLCVPKNQRNLLPVCNLGSSLF